MFVYGGLVRLLPVAYIATFICSLIAIPYTAGSKDLILEIHASQDLVAHQIGFVIGIFVATIKLLIITYTARLNTIYGGG